MIIDTYELKNGYRAELMDSEYSEKFMIDIKREDENQCLVVCKENPFDAIFILMDLGLITTDIDWCEPRVLEYREGSHYQI